MFDKILDNLFGSTIRISVLHLLIMSKKSFTGAQIAKETGYSRQRVNKVCQHLFRWHVLKMRRIGNGVEYQANFDNIPLQVLLKPLFKQKLDLRDFN